MADVTVITISPDELRQMVQPKGVDPERWHNVIVPSSWFCRMHSISPATLSRWISNGIVTPEPRDKEGNYNFRLSYILKFRPEEVKGKHKSNR